MKKHISTIVLIAVFLVGLSLLLYPTISNYWNASRSTKAIATYVEKVSSLNEEEYASMLEKAKEYNTSLRVNGQTQELDDTRLVVYEQLLDVGGTGIMGYIDIESLGIHLPIYHGTSESVLQVGIGHLDWTSLPMGGTGTHCVISGHRGLPSARLFTDLDELTTGDTFVIRTLDEVLTYQVDQILIVEPEDTEALMIEEDKDFCTLVTCTPYGVNSHRLLVRGYRITTPEDAPKVYVTSEAVQVEPLIVASVLAVPMLLTLLVVLLVRSRRKK